MSVNIELKEFLKFFQKTSFRIAFLLGTILFKILTFNYSNDVFKIIADVLSVLASIFLLDDLFSRLGFFISKKIKHKKIKCTLHSLNKSQVLVLVDYFFDFSSDIIKINQTGYFKLTDGLYNELTSAGLITQALVGIPSSFPFMMLVWVYDDLNDALKNKNIEIKFKSNETEIKWYESNYIYTKNELNKEEYI